MRCHHTHTAPLLDRAAQPADDGAEEGTTKGRGADIEVAWDHEEEEAWQRDLYSAPRSGKEGRKGGRMAKIFSSLLRFAVSHRIYAEIVTMKQFRPTPIRPFVSPILALLSPEKCGWALKLSVCMREAAADRYSLQCS